jgi:hypothetical protein
MDSPGGAARRATVSAVACALALVPTCAAGTPSAGTPSASTPSVGAPSASTSPAGAPSASTPSAGHRPAYVTGSGAYADDWSAEPLLRADGGTRPSDLVGLWQAILWADGYLPGPGITCAFDATTSEATQTWQSNHGLGADGIVGAATFGFAARRLVPAPPWTAYRGEKYTLPLRRGRDGVYEVYDTGRFHGLRTDAVTLASCRR